MWEERWHPLREEWVIVAAHRQSRPWSGAEVGAQAPRPPAFDPACYLCPGNARVSGALNAVYTRHLRVRQRPSVRRLGRAA